MDQDQFLLYDQKNPIELRAERMALYRQGEIIEAISKDNEVYYLFFYKYQFLTAVKSTRLRRLSFIQHAFADGMVFNAPHPLINKFLASNHPCKIVSYKLLLNKLEKSYTSQEKAFILTFFESFIPKKQLFNEIKSVFYQYNRNGQTFLGYQIVRILIDFAPDHSLVEQLATDIKVEKYADLYRRESDKILSKDPIFAEKALYAKKDSDKSFQQLTDRLEKDNRWIDLVALFSHKLTKTPSAEFYRPLIRLLEQHFNEQEKMFFLETLSEEITDFIPLQHDLFVHYVQHHKIEEVSRMMTNYDFELSNSQIEIFGDLLEQLDLKKHTFEPEMLHTLLKPILTQYPDKGETLLKKSVVSLLKSYDLDYIENWLEPFKDIRNDLEVVGKIHVMVELLDDPDQMQALGELYYEFREMDQAVECFSWETELKPDDPKPLQWLAKAYGEMGMPQESEAYRQMCINLQKLA
ncbi:hypothetical protein ACTWQL_08640 [Pseudalkalibacillus sp. R45]|uniref:hypothetical protein n=1 Tax=Pseudalkalibacillus sp. R45 TaxID=3457433 RepID=UPI003FCE9351